MFPDWNQARRRITSQLDGLASKWAFRLVVSVILVCFHLGMFTRAGHDLLGLPFNSAPGEAPYFSNPDAPSTRGYPRQPHRWSRLVVSRLDAQHYIGTAVRGVSACPKTANVHDSQYLDCGLGWLPAYGFAGGVVAQLTGLADDVALLLLSIISALAINLLWTSRTMVKRIGRFEAYATLLAFNLYPSAFYVVTPYTEAATIALVMGGFIALVNERWMLAALLVGASTALRISTAACALALGAALLVAAWQRRRNRTPGWWRPLIALPLCGWGQFAEMIVLRVTVGDGRAFWRARHAFGDQHDYSRLLSPTYYLKGFGAQNLDSVIFVGVLAIIVMTCRQMLRRFTAPETVYLVVASLATGVLVVLAPLNYWGITRYLMLCPLAYLGMGALARRQPVLYVLWLALCVLFYWHIELCSYITQNQPGLCPCLGRYEFGMPFAS